MRAFDPIAIARQFLYVREAQSQGQNRGLRVESIQHWAGGQTADSWCQEFVWFVFDIAYQGQPPFDRVQSTEEFRKLGLANGWAVTIPSAGDIVLSLKPDGTAHHVGIITKVSPLTAIAGNTSEDGTSSNGDRVAEHFISNAQKLYIHIPIGDE